MSILFRFKNGDLFKGKRHRPFAGNVTDLDHYKGQSYRLVTIVTDYRKLKTSDMIYLYKLLNNRLDCGFNVSRAYKPSAELFQISGTFSDNKRCFEYDIFINDCPTDIYQAIWDMVKEPLFGHVPKEVSVECGDGWKILDLIEHKKPISLVKLKSSSKSVQINTTQNKVVTNTNVSTLIRKGGSSIKDNDYTIVEYELTDYTKWLFVTPHDNDNDAMIYTRYAGTKCHAWDNYVGDSRERR